MTRPHTANDNARPLTAWASGGDVILPGGPIRLELARQQLGFHARVAIQMREQGHRHEARQAALIALDYEAAIRGAEAWRRAGRIGAA